MHVFLTEREDRKASREKNDRAMQEQRGRGRGFSQR